MTLYGGTGTCEDPRIGILGGSSKTLPLVNEFTHSFSHQIFSAYLLCARLGARGPNSVKLYMVLAFMEI